MMVTMRSIMRLSGPPRPPKLPLPGVGPEGLGCPNEAPLLQNANSSPSMSAETAGMGRLLLLALTKGGQQENQPSQSRSAYESAVLERDRLYGSNMEKTHTSELLVAHHSCSHLPKWAGDLPTVAPMTPALTPALSPAALPRARTFTAGT